MVERIPVRDMAAVLAEHRMGHTIGYAVHCVCDPETGYSPDVFYRHQAEALAEAGFGGAEESVLDLEADIDAKEETAGEMLLHIAAFAKRLPVGCETSASRIAMLRMLKAYADEALKVLHEINGLRQGIRRIAP